VIMLAVGFLPRRRAPILGLVSIVGLVAIAISLWAVFYAKGPVFPGAVAAAGSGLPSTPGSTPTPPGGTTPSGGPPCSPSGSALKETVQNISYQNTCLAAPGGSPFTIDFDNRDSGVPHNIHIFSTNPATDPQARSLFVGPLVTGPKTQTYRVPTLAPGTYYFHCDIHPMQMQGTLIVR
jgi:hypothetical protein